MLANTGIADRVVRLAAAAALIVIALTLQPSTGVRIVLFVLAGIAVTTAVSGFCPLYRLFGWSTRRKRS